MTPYEELELPQTLLTRIVKSSLPDGTLLQKDAKALLAKTSTLFISYLTAMGLDIAENSRHKTLTTEDIFQALQVMELDSFIPSLRTQLINFQQSKKEKKKLFPTSFVTDHQIEEDPESVIDSNPFPTNM